MPDTVSNLLPALDRLTQRSARGIVARARVASPGLRHWLTHALSAPAGAAGSLLADPLIEAAKTWELADQTLADLSPGLLAPELVAALHDAGPQAMPRNRCPRAHQLEAWQASLVQKRSVLVTAGTGAGKTECFLIPILHDILMHPRPGGGVQAILLYPLNALIESQRERLAAWARGLGGKVRFALLNGDTPETEHKTAIKSDAVELRSRAKIREKPPEILVTNITMLEYLLLRAQDQKLLELSEGALRWIVLDEAHSYVGSQAAELALLLRRVRAGFGVAPADVRLIATSATIGGGDSAHAELRAFAAALAGQGQDRVAVVQGRERAPDLPPLGADVPFDLDTLAKQVPDDAGRVLAPHPRVQSLIRAMAAEGVPLSSVSRLLFGDPTFRAEAVRVLDAAGRAVWRDMPLLPWRAHLFHRGQGGVWACPDSNCSCRAPELAAEGSGWHFGAAYLTARARCECGAPVYELVICTDCGKAHLQGVLTGGAQPRLNPPDPGEGDDFALDAEPEEDEGPAGEAGIGWLVPGAGIWLADDCRIYDNAAPGMGRAWPMRLIERAEERGCCPGVAWAHLSMMRYGPNFLMGNALGEILEDLAAPDGAQGLPAGGRRALTFSDSRQGVARLAAKLQQDAERSLTRAFLWHTVQKRPVADPQHVAELEAVIARLRAATGLEDIAERKEQELAALVGAAATPVRWPDLVGGLATHADVTGFVGDIWRQRWLGQVVGAEPEQLAEMFLYRELFRRPRVQNNPETMGLLRLFFPAMEERALRQGPPRPLAMAGLDAQSWVGLAQATVDIVFRNNYAIHLEKRYLSRLINPRRPGIRSIFASDMGREEVDTADAIYWPTPIPRGRLSRLARLVYALIGGDPESAVDQDRAAMVLDALWSLITSTAARDVGRGAWRLDFNRAAVQRLDQAWLCPVLRRPYADTPGGFSPNDPLQRMEPVRFPRLPVVNPGGLTADQRVEAAAWCETDVQVGELRARGLWTDLHDRLATFPPYIRAQEHSAQIQRATLQRYEGQFKAGRINLLNCSTTMEMGVDIADVRLVVNANVPPALTNYRQRSGRAGRRGEPWAFTLTFCRDLPLDRRVFDRPQDFLRRPIMAPKVWFGSPALVQRHVNAALLAGWMSEQGGHSVRGSIGSFLGAGETLGEPVLPDPSVDRFLASLDGDWGNRQAGVLEPLVAGTVLAMEPTAVLLIRARDALDRLVRDWRVEHLTLLQGAAARDAETRTAMEMRAKRLAGEFLLGELARRGFSPAYGFPTDVVTFTHLPRHEMEEEEQYSLIRRGTASRQLDQAIREYAPGAELVIDGLVYQSEGVMPAWKAGVDASRLEDIRTLWSCNACHAFGLGTADQPSCPVCGVDAPSRRKVLRPAGFLGGRHPHVGYENIAHVAPDPVRLSAQGGDWVALPDCAGRMRADARGQVATSAAGLHGSGFAICLDCGRAAPMNKPHPGIPATLPDAIRCHEPLFRRDGLITTQDGFCSSANAPHRIQPHVHLAQVTRSDVWEWQLHGGWEESAVLTLAAALRESLAEALGVEPAEIGPAVDRSTGPAGETCISAFLHDRAAGGAGLVARMIEPETLTACLRRAEQLLDCRDNCRRACPSCILRPDLNRRGLVLDRHGALALTRALLDRFVLNDDLCLFGPETRLAGQSITQLLAARLRSGRLAAVDVWLHGEPADWDMAGWNMRPLFGRMADEQIRPKLHLARTALTSAGFDLAQMLALLALTPVADLHLVDALPMVGGHPLLVRLDGDDGAEGLAAIEAAEVPLGANWGLGAVGPLLIGPAPDLAPGPVLTAIRLMELHAGNVRVLYPGSALDGPAAGFGKRFWTWVKRQAEFPVGAMEAVGITDLIYSDRYLLNPGAARLLAEVLGAVPGATGARRSIIIACADRSPRNPKFLHDGFPNDTMRCEVLGHLIPDAEIELKKKQEMSHHRALMIQLSDGRALKIFLDQGFGAWRMVDFCHHDFAARSEDQAHNLRAAVFQVMGASADGAPLALTFDGKAH